jgi:hypothetical protein
MKLAAFHRESSEAMSGWDFQPVFREKAAIENQNIFLCGMQAQHKTLGEATGSAASLGAFPENSAWYELVERIGIIQSLNRESFLLKHPTTDLVQGEIDGKEVFPTSASPHYHFAKSNGVALFTNWSEACRRAAMEMVERHLVLASWLGYSKPMRMIGIAKTPLFNLKSIYQVEHYDFGRQKLAGFSTSIYVSGIVLKPLNTAHPLIMGFGAGFSQVESIQKAEGETWQRLGFLWGEEIPSSPPAFAPHQLYHQEYYLYPKNHHQIDSWLKGGFYNESLNPLPSILSPSFVDMSLDSDYRIAKAISRDAIPLVFGNWREGSFATLAEDRLIHPIA